MGETADEARPAEGKVKFFGTVLPPKCELHGCFLSDDGAHFYCTDFSCNKHRSKRTKHNRYSRWKHLDDRRWREGDAPQPRGEPVSSG